MTELPAERSRDQAGRPRNDRPRDELGRPLEHGQTGVPGIPEDVELTPAQALTWAQQLLDDGRAFQAHEVLEVAWKAAPDPERDLWRGLAQLAVGLTHAQRGNLVGAARLLRRGADRVRPWAADPPHQIDIDGLMSWAGRTADQIESGTPEPGELTTPRLLVSG
ncbi:MAG: DUF309 domain-containing protein [Sporichthyaceae bacterium]|nr:DUF309 domain-containing protein [Sporichthyaceae bacterium]